MAAGMDEDLADMLARPVKWTAPQPDCGTVNEPEVVLVTRRCLKCDREFGSTGKGHRLCWNCNNANMGHARSRAGLVKGGIE